MKPAPFSLSDEAAAHVQRSLAAAQPDMVAALVWSPRAQGDKEEPAVVLGWYEKGARAKDSFYDVCGHAVSILPSTLAQIEGRTISLTKFSTGRPNGRFHHHVLQVS